MKRIRVTESQIRRVIQSMVSENTQIRGYMFDWDDNILFMPTKIRMEKKDGEKWIPVDVSTEEFREVRTNPDYRLINNDPEEAFFNFRDDDVYMADVKRALASGSYGPSYDKFLEAIKYINPFSIITARGHSPAALRAGTEELLYHALSAAELKNLASDIREKMGLESEGYEDDEVIDYYLDTQKYNPVSSDEFLEIMKKKLGDSDVDASNPEVGKKLAIEDFVDGVIKAVENAIKSGENVENISFGFSDDDKGNVEAAEKLIQDTLNKKYPDVKFVVYDTGDSGNIIKIKKY